MNCVYCDQISEAEAVYAAREAVFDLGSAAPRCSWHWRYLCGQCGRPSHFMAMSFCPDRKAFFCAGCAQDQREIANAFWAWKYYFSYRSPWSGQWLSALDRLEYEGQHPLQQVKNAGMAQEAIDQEPFLIRYPVKAMQWRSAQEVRDAEVQANWDRNAQRWDSMYDEDGP